MPTTSLDRRLEAVLAAAEPRPAAVAIGAAAEARALFHAAQARRARARRDWEACRASTLGALRAAAESLGGVEDCMPARGGLGGFFACSAVAGGSRCFVKGVLAGSREMRFWTAWRHGAVRTEGRHYRLLPPRAILLGRVLGVLVFPELEELREPPRLAPYRRHVRRIVRAMADFNSDHPLAAGSGVRPSQVCDPVPVPGRRRVQQLLGVDAGRAREIVAMLRRIEPRWGALRDRLYRARQCLGHMDLGRTNVLPDRQSALMLDFGNAGAAPAGADLHVLRRYLGADGPPTDELVGSYVEVFARKGLPADPAAVRLNLDAHFAARYRDLRLLGARNPATFEAALATSLALLDRAGTGS